MFRRLPNFILFSNLFIALGAGALMWESYLLFHRPMQFFFVVLGIAATFFVYNIDRLVDLKKLSHSLGERHQWIIRNRKLLWVLTTLCFLWLCFSLFFLSWQMIIFLAHLTFISVAYSIPVIPYKGHWISLRKIKALKIFLIAYVWMTSTVILPVFSFGGSIFQRDVLLLMVERGLFIFAITIPFDVRDYQLDRQTETTTIPGLIGIQNSIRLAALLLLALIVLCFIHYSIYSGAFWAKLISALSTLVLVLYTSHQRHEYFYTGLLDGTILIQFLLVLLFS